jgi:hypothetical protein
LDCGHHSSEATETNRLEYYINANSKKGKEYDDKKGKENDDEASPLEQSSVFSIADIFLEHVQSLAREESC